MKEKLRDKLKLIRVSDLGHPFLFALALLPAALLRRRRPQLWLLCENRSEARDNGYRFFRYLREQQPQVDAVYAIDPASPEAERVKSLGETVPFGSFRHWVLYLAAQVNVSSQKNGKPNAALCYLLEVKLRLLKNRRVFLQHGVIKDDLPFLHNDEARLWLFACGAEPEYRFVRDTFGYPEGVVRYLGLCRFDSLHGQQADKDLLLILPTWRRYLQRGGDREAFLRSDFYRCWNALLTDGRLDALLEKWGKRAVFVLHREMGAFEDAFRSDGGQIEVLGWQQADISALIRRCGTLITDFSSVYMDFAYMKKPLLYYQFDTALFREGHWPLGYFDYERDGFGPICGDEDALLTALEESFARDCRMEERYRERVERFYTLCDTHNCERTYEAVCEKLKAEGRT